MKNLSSTLRSPEIFAPAIIPVQAGKKIPNIVIKEWPSRKSGQKLSENVDAEYWTIPLDSFCSERGRNVPTKKLMKEPTIIPNKTNCVCKTNQYCFWITSPTSQHDKHTLPSHFSAFGLSINARSPTMVMSPTIRTSFIKLTITIPCS